MSFADFQNADRRLVLLQALQAAAQYRANTVLLRAYLDRVGHVVSSDRLEQDISWLAEQGLVATERAESVTVAVLTVRGLDVATGRAKVPGVHSPGPGTPGG